MRDCRFDLENGNPSDPASSLSDSLSDALKRIPPFFTDNLEAVKQFSSYILAFNLHLRSHRFAGVSARRLSCFRACDTIIIEISLKVNTFLRDFSILEECIYLTRSDC